MPIATVILLRAAIVPPAALLAAPHGKPTTAQIEQAKTGDVWRGVEGHSMQYLLSLPADWSAKRTWPVIVIVTGSNSNFPVIAKGYRSARGDLPFILVTPATVSSGSQIIKERYEHLPEDEIKRLAAATMPGKLEYDVQGIKRILADIQKHFGGEQKVYLSGFSMGGTLAWHMALHHSDRFHAVFPVCACYDGAAQKLVRPGHKVATTGLPIFAFQGKGDHMVEGFDSTWAQASQLAAELGMSDVKRSVTWRKHSWHHEEITYFCYGHYLGRREHGPVPK